MAFRSQCSMYFDIPKWLGVDIKSIHHFQWIFRLVLIFLFLHCMTLIVPKVEVENEIIFLYVQLVSFVCVLLEQYLLVKSITKWLLFSDCQNKIPFFLDSLSFLIKKFNNYFSELCETRQLSLINQKSNI